MIQVGEGVRTKTGKITKLKKIYCRNVFVGHGLMINQKCCDFENGLYIYGDDFPELYKKIDEMIVKHSFNIIDLIEENDIIEYKVNCLSEKKVSRVRKYIDARSNKEYLGVEGFDIKKIYVERILTYEQYEKKCYKSEE